MKRALLILLAIAAPLLAMAQPRYTVEKIPMCWTVSAVDSSVTKIVLISSVSDQLITIGYYNADGAEVTVSGGTLAYGYCGTGGGGGGGDDDWRWYVPGDDTYAQPLYRVGKTNIFVTNAADTLHGFRVDSTFQFRMDGGRDIFDWQVGGGTGYDFTPHAGLFYRAPGTFEQNGLGSGHNQITIGLDDSTILSRDRLGAIVFAGRNPSGTGGYRPGAMITAFADGNWYPDSNSTSINFYVTRPNQTTMNNVVTFERNGRVELDYYQTFEDGIPERMMGFTNLSDDMTAHTITGTPGANKVLGINEYNTAMTWKDPGDVVQAETRHIVYQPAHGFILPAHGFIPVYLDTITGWELALATDSLTLHDSYIVEVISVDTFVLQEAGILRVPAGHGLLPGSDYFLTDVGGIATTPGFHNDWLATVWDTITLALKATRPVLGAVPDTTVYLQGAGTANQVAIYANIDSLTSYPTYTFNGTDNLTYYNTGLSQFTLGRFYLKYDSIATAQQLLLGSTNRILSLPRSNSNGLIIYPSADNSTTSAALTFSTGRTNVQDANIVEVNTPQYIGSLSGASYALNLNNNISQDGSIDVSNGLAGGINIQQTWTLPTDAANQKTEYYGIRLRPNINRTSNNNDNYFGIHIAPSLSGNAAANWRGIYNTTSQGFFLADVGGAHNYLQGTLRIGYSISSTNYKLHVTRNSGSYPLSVFSGANSKFVRKGTSNEDIFTSSSNYDSYPQIVGMTPGPGSQMEISSLVSSAHHNTGIIGLSYPVFSAPSEAFGIIGYAGTQMTPDASYTSSGTAIIGVAEHLLVTSEAADIDFSGSTYSLYGVRGLVKMSQDWTNGTFNTYAGHFNGNGTNLAAGTNATNSYGIYTRAEGGTTSNWSIYSDEGDHYYEDNSKFGGSVVTPTATVDIEGSGRFRAGSTPASVEDGETWTSSTQQALVSNQSGIIQSLAGTIFTGTADATVANTVTETSIIPTGIGTVTLPANFLVAGKTIKIDAWGIWEADTIPSTLELRVELGGTLLCTTGAQTMVTCEGGEWHMEAIFTCRTTGASGTTYSQGEVDFMSAFTTSVKHWMRRSATNTIDTTVSNLLDVTATHGAADADNSITTTNITITVLN